MHGKLNFATGYVNVQSSVTGKFNEFIGILVKFDEIGNCTLFDVTNRLRNYNLRGQGETLFRSHSPIYCS